MTTRVVNDELDSVLGRLAKKQYELFNRVRAGRVSSEIALDGLQLLLENHRVVKAGQSQKKGKGMDSRLQELDRFYREIFGGGHDCDNLMLKPNPEGMPWTVLMASWLTYDIVEDAFTHNGIPYVKWTEKRLSEVIDLTKEARSPWKGGYAIALRDRVEADEENKNLSTNRCAARGIDGITLLERLVLELWHWWKSKQHLDIYHGTLCSGSRYLDGFVPDVNFSSNDKVDVSMCNPDYDDDDELLRSRSAVSIGH